jgi:calcineurin-like phosphoesterase family protein
MRVWFTADLHLGHGNIIRYCQRPHLSPQEQKLLQEQGSRGKWRVSAETVRRHDDALLAAINDVVEPDDLLWILGDFCWGGLVEATAYRARIHCRNLHFVWGNHDHHAIRPIFAHAIEQGMIEVEGQSIWLNHYPMRSWNRSFHGAWHLYGHVHGRLAREDAAADWTLTRDVGVDACNYRPLSFDDLSDYMGPRIEKFQRRKAGMSEGGGDEIN